jgi:PAS domain S-box-containing protein
MTTTAIVRKLFTRRLTPWKITALYALVGGLWVLFSDKLLVVLVTNPEILTRLQTFKGWLYVIATAWMLYVLINRGVAALQPSQAGVRSSAAQLRACGENSREVFWLRDLETNQTSYVSPSYEEIWGKSWESIYGQSRFWTDAIHPDESDRVIAAFEKALRGEGNFHQDYRIVRPDNSERWVRDRAFPIYNKAGQFYSLAGVAEDITQRKQLEAALRRLNEELNLKVQQRTPESRPVHQPLGVEIVARSQEEEECHQFFTLSLDMMCIAGFDGYFKHLNPAWEKNLGFTREELAARPYLEFVHPEDCPATVAAAQQITQGINVISFENRYRCKDGSYKWLSWNATPLPNQQLVYAVVQDITERRQAEAALRELNQRIFNILESITDGFFALDRQWRFTYLNPQAEPLLHKTRAQLLGKNIWEEFPDAVGTIFFEQFHKAVSEQVSVEFEGLYAPLNQFSEVHAYPSKDGLSVYFTDITERKRTEAELLRSLEKERELNELKSRIVSVVSHEYRTPLTTILSSAELLKHYGHTWSEDKKHQHLNRIQISVHHLTQLVSDVLILDKAEAGKLEFNPVPLNVVAFCHELVEELQMTTGDERILSKAPVRFLTQGETCQVCLDEKLLRQMLTNLLSNAIKYSRPGGTVHFALIFQPNEVIFRIQDEGIGISREDQQHLFESFYRASNVGTIPGTGLGLVIVKKCVDLHGGQIAVESEVGIGTTFTVTLPLDRFQN